MKKPFPYKTPTAPAELESVASVHHIDSVIRCPTCGRVYGDHNGFHKPCEHLVAHFGPFGWERTPHKGGDVARCITGESAFKLIDLLVKQGRPLVKVTSGENDSDWLVWSKPAVVARMVA